MTCCGKIHTVWYGRNPYRDTWRPGPHPLRQRPRIHGGTHPPLARGPAGADVVHRAGSPWENGYVESFNGKLRDELLDREIFYTLTEVKILIERWRRQYKTVRPSRALGYRPPAPETVMPAPMGGLNHEPSSLIRTDTTTGAGHARSPARPVVGLWGSVPPGDVHGVRSSPREDASARDSRSAVDFTVPAQDTRI